MNALVERARAWMASDVDPVTKQELEGLLSAPDLAATDLSDRFLGELEFGTAGLRGVLGAGPNRMNAAVVVRATWGFAKHLEHSIPEARSKGVVIGYDGRRGSTAFSEYAASVLSALGFRVHLFPTVVPTPLCAFAVRFLGAAGGIMITASHNPPEYNGYKVYWENAAQIIPPHDVDIAARIAACPAAREVPCLELAVARQRGLVQDVDPSVEEAYFREISALAVHTQTARDFPIVYTPLHGVGDRFARRALADAGFSVVYSVPEQAAPDGEFPTVAFPNPEEKGAMDLSFALARSKRAELVLANDPDADRLAVAIPDAESPTGYLQLSGNEVGFLLGHYLLTERPVKDALVIASLVSSPLLGRIANKLGVRYEETLTGFKWIANRAMELEKTTPAEFVFGYEEALGYTVGRVVRDKDGVSAAMLFAELVSVLRSRGQTVSSALESIHRTYGLFVSSQVNATRKGAAGLSEIQAIMRALRERPPSVVAELSVIQWSDYQVGKVQRAGSSESEALSLPPSNVLAYGLSDGSRIIARPSGTEPKIKFYFDVCEQMGPAETLAEARRRADDKMKRLSEAFLLHVQ